MILNGESKIETEKIKTKKAIGVGETKPIVSPAPNPRIQFAKYASINFFYYLSVAFGGYVTVFLQSIGFSAQHVGMVSSISATVGVFSSPTLGTISDKIRSIKKVIILALSVAAFLFALIPLSSRLYIGNLSLVIILIPLAMFFKMPSMALVDNWTLRNSAAEGLNYGAMRSFGAISYAIASLLLGYFLPITGVELTFYLYGVFVVPTILMLLSARGTADNEAASKKRLKFKEMKIGQLFKNYYLVTYIAFTVVQRIPFQCGFIFLPFLIVAVGGNPAQLGIVLGIRALAEIPMMLLLKPLSRKLPLYVIIMMASVLYATEFILYSMAGSFTAIVLISMLHGLANGLLLPANTGYIISLAPEHLKATTQTVLSSMASAAGIIGALLGGALIEIIGITDFFFIIGIVTAIALLLFISSFIIGEKFLKIKRPGMSPL